MNQIFWIWCCEFFWFTIAEVLSHAFSATKRIFTYWIGVSRVGIGVCVPRSGFRLFWLSTPHSRAIIWIELSCFEFIYDLFLLFAEEGKCDTDRLKNRGMFKVFRSYVASFNAFIYLLIYFVFPSIYSTLRFVSKEEMKPTFWNVCFRYFCFLKIKMAGQLCQIAILGKLDWILCCFGS